MGGGGGLGSVVDYGAPNPPSPTLTHPRISLPQVNQLLQEKDALVTRFKALLPSPTLILPPLIPLSGQPAVAGEGHPGDAPQGPQRRGISSLSAAAGRGRGRRQRGQQRGAALGAVPDAVFAGVGWWWYQLLLMQLLN